MRIPFTNRLFWLKVPFRKVYAARFDDWIKAIIWCFVVKKIFPCCADFESDPLMPTYLNNPIGFYNQYIHFYNEVRQRKGLLEIKEAKRLVIESERYRKKIKGKRLKFRFIGKE
jgi:hypothetical protein